ncbi:MAG TPA: sulfotransferase [Caulobacteraceae bacterium]|nr:sulfotransferase [Caulobacteraceae bacterium]
MSSPRSKPEKRRPGAPRDPAGASRFLEVAVGHARAGRLAEAARAYERAEAADPDDFRAPFSLATIDLQRGRPAEALPRLRRVVQLKPDLFEAHHNLGGAAQTLELWDEAAGAYAAALTLRPDALESRRNLAIVLAILGRIDAAIAQHRQLALAPETRAWALTRIALLRPGEITDADLEALRRAAADPPADLQGDPDGGRRDDRATRTGALFALGEVLERRGDPEPAFAAFAAGNALQRDAIVAGGVDPPRLVRQHAAAAEAVIARFTPELLQRRAGEGLSTAAPIFVVGMPRSGSTLIEQILATHPQVAGLGETGLLPPMLERGFAEGQAETRALARRYLEAVRARGWRGGGRFVDKTLENYLHVGAIALMFPGAVILHAVRDPVDSCLSCYRQLFAQGAETLYDLGEIGAEYVTYRRVMSHWREALPGRVIDVDYEALAADPPARIRALVCDAAGLAWDDACLAFHQAGGPVRTASSGQVREPIFTGSIARWRRYEAQLSPLLAALGPYAP